MRLNWMGMFFSSVETRFGSCERWEVTRLQRRSLRAFAWHGREEAWKGGLEQAHPN